jgi:hypothetical protein
MLAELDKLALATVPGTKYEYSNFGMSLLGLVIERATHQRYREYMNEHVLAPLGMRSTTWDAPPHMTAGYDPQQHRLARWQLGDGEAAGGLYTTLADMGRYAAFQLAAYPPRDADDRGPLRRASVREAHTGQTTVTLVTSPERTEGVGLAWWSFRTCEVAHGVRHTGGVDGFSTSIQLYPDHGIALILLTNEIDVNAAAINDAALAILRASGGFAPRSAPLSPLLKKVIDDVIAIQNEPTPARYQALLGKPLRDAIPYEAIAAQVAAIHEKHGTCMKGVPIEIETGTTMSFALLCDRGHMEYSVQVDKDGTLIAASDRSFDEPELRPPSACRERASM